MPLRHTALVLLAVLGIAGCQAPAPPTPTLGPGPAQATATPVPATMTPVVAPATVAPSPIIPSVASTPPPNTATRIETLNAASEAFDAGDLATAAGLYERVLNTPPGPTESAATRAAIDQFANFRALVAFLADGREEDARDRLDDLHRDPNAPLSRLGDQLYDQYGMVGALRGACAQVQPQVASQAGAVLGTLQSAGVSADAATLCSSPG